MCTRKAAAKLAGLLSFIGRTPAGPLSNMEQTAIMEFLPGQGAKSPKAISAKNKSMEKEPGAARQIYLMMFMALVCGQLSAGRRNEYSPEVTSRFRPSGRRMDAVVLPGTVKDRNRSLPRYSHLLTTFPTGDR